MNVLPDKMFLRRGEAREFLGLSRSAFTKLIRAGVLQPEYFPGMTYAYFNRSAVLAVKSEGRNPEKTQSK